MQQDEDTLRIDVEGSDFSDNTNRKRARLAEPFVCHWQSLVKKVMCEEHYFLECKGCGELSSWRMHNDNEARYCADTVLVGWYKLSACMHNNL